MPESALEQSPTRLSISQLALDGRMHLCLVAPFKRGTQLNGRRICESSDPNISPRNVLRHNMGRLPFLLQPVLSVAVYQFCQSIDANPLLRYAHIAYLAVVST